MNKSNIAVSHCDADGVLCIALLLKVKEVEKVYFTSPAKLVKTLCIIISGEGYENSLYVFDMSGKKESLTISSVFNEVLWIDHHEWDETEKNKKLENLTLVLDSNAKSAASVVNEYFHLNSDLASYADEIDTNNMKTEASEKIYHVVESLKSEFKYKELLDFARKISRDENEIFNDSYNEIIDKHKKWLDDAIKMALQNLEIKNIKNLKIGIVEKDFVPLSKIFDNVDCDILIGVTRQNTNTKIEFRSKNYDVYSIAKKLGGGGHKMASGTTLNGIFTKDFILSWIEELI